MLDFFFFITFQTNLFYKSQFLYSFLPFCVIVNHLHFYGVKTTKTLNVLPPWLNNEASMLTSRSYRHLRSGKLPNTCPNYSVRNQQCLQTASGVHLELTKEQQRNHEHDFGYEQFLFISWPTIYCPETSKHSSL